MKKRIISFALVVLMLVTLVPFSAFAATGDNINITKQPVDAYVDEGQTATFKITASTLNNNNLKFIWVDADKINTDNITDITTFLAALGDGKLGEGTELKINNVTNDMDGMTLACVVYYFKYYVVIGDIEVSNTVTLHVNPLECESHSADTNLEKIDAKEPTCAEEGNIAYYYCADCRRYYLDENGTVRTTPDECGLAKLTTHGDMVYVEATEGTCCDYGHNAYYKCETCGQMFSDAEGTATVTERSLRTDKIADNHTNLQHFDAVAATCSEKGSIEYWYCDGCGNYYTDAAGTAKISKAKLDTDKNSKNHTDLVEYPAVAASCTAPGNIHYWYCSGCRDYFSDSMGRNEISRSDTVIKQLEHTNEWFAMCENDAEWHELRCTECGTVKQTGAHSGGEAGCCDKAVCTVCGHEYGEINPDNHKNLERDIIKEATVEEDGLCNVYCSDCGALVEENVPYAYKDTCLHHLVYVEEVPAKCVVCDDAQGMKAHYVCEICGAMFSDENGEKEITDPDSLIIAPQEHDTTYKLARIAKQQYSCDASGHWIECEYCGYVYIDTISNHLTLSSVKATCCSGQTCIFCGWDNGERDSENHVGGTELVGACEPADGKPGYTGDEICKGCEAVLKKGWEYYPACGDCANHLEHIAAVPSTCTMDGTLEHWKCSLCGNIYMDARATIPGDNDSINDKCTGHELHPGRDLLGAVDVLTLTSKLGWDTNKILEIIQSGNYSDLKNIRIEDFLDQITIKDIDHCHDDEYHWLGCQKCGLSLADIREDLEKQGLFINPKWYEISEKQAHTGGVADCSHKAICDVCGEEYGELGEHRYNKVGKDATCTESGYIKYVCNGCGKEDTARAETFPALGHCYVKGVCSRCNARNSNPFWDVKSSDIYYTAVMWAYTYDPQITAGKTDNYFKPADDCTRGQVVTFLWRAAGRPEPASAVNPFNDVFNYGACAPYYKAILWAAEQGITTGYSDGSFQPNKTVSRAEFVTFLWRYYGKPAPSTNLNPFVDVSETSVFRNAILWAYGQGITTGYDATHFQPNKTCNRWQVVMFMYRAIGEGKAY